MKTATGSAGDVTAGDAAAEAEPARVVGRGRHWRPRVEASERRDVIAQLFSDGDGRAHWSRYYVMLTLSAVIATAGLSANSGAVVIGAMLVAPLMMPIVGFVAAISLNMPRRAAIATVVVVTSTIWTIAVSVGVAAILPASELGSEVISRTAPDVRDLLVALAAGVAGTWATARTNVSSALPGVAVAVALVPPLATVGITLHAGEMQYAEGALLLYVTNLVAIVGIGTITMLAVGFVPTALLTRSWHTLGTTVAISLAAIGGISWPLWERAEHVAHETRISAALEDIVQDWLSTTPALEADTITRRGRSVTVDVVGPVEPPPADDLSQAITTRLADRYDVRVRWSQRLDGPMRVAGLEDGDPIDEVGRIADDWLVEVNRPDLTIESITVSGTEVAVRVVGPRQPPSGIVLQRRLTEAFPDAGYVVTVTWTEISVIDDQTATLEGLRSELAEAARSWAAGLGVDVVAVDASFDRVVVRTAGVEPPGDAAALHGEIARIAATYDVSPSVLVTFEARTVIPATAPTTTTTTTPTTSTTTAPPPTTVPTAAPPLVGAPTP